MTTNILITAHCSEDKEVHVHVNNDLCVAGNSDSNYVVILQNEQEHELSIYDDKSVSVKEVNKSSALKTGDIWEVEPGLIHKCIGFQKNGEAVIEKYNIYGTDGSLED